MGVIAQRYFSISTYLPTYISYEIHLDHLATGVVILLLPKFPRLLHTYDFRTLRIWDHPYVTSGHIWTFSEPPTRPLRQHKYSTC